jgi:restriction system protein
MWMIRNNGGDYAEEFIRQSIVGIGWKGMGSLKAIKTREQMIQKVQEVYPDHKKLQSVVAGSQLDKFANQMKLGDRVITYDPSTRIYHVGQIKGDYEFDHNADDGLANRRKVVWEGQVLRDALSVPTKNSLGSSLTVFELSDVAVKEIDLALSGQSLVPTTAVSSEIAETSTDSLLADLKAKAKEFIKDRVIDLDWSELQHLVAGILRAMNYKTQISPEGGDRGKDIVASPDGFGFENPRIIVEVKHRPKQPIGSQEIRSFLGGRHKDDRGLYVSTGGYTKEAKYEAERAAIPLTLLDIDGLVEALVDYYEHLDLATRTLVPLTRIYWPS